MGALGSRLSKIARAAATLACLRVARRTAACADGVAASLRDDPHHRRRLRTRGGRLSLRHRLRRTTAHRQSSRCPRPHVDCLVHILSCCRRRRRGVLLQYVFPGARGSGIPQVKVAYASRDGRVPLRDAVGKFVLGSLQIGSGGSLGREGPTVQICAGIASFLGRLRRSRRRAAGAFFRSAPRPASPPRSTRRSPP